MQKRYLRNGENAISYRYPKKDVSVTAIIGDNPPISTRQGILQYAVQQTENSYGSTVSRGTSRFSEWKVMH